MLHILAAYLSSMCHVPFCIFLRKDSKEERNYIVEGQLQLSYGGLYTTIFLRVSRSDKHACLGIVGNKSKSHQVVPSLNETVETLVEFRIKTLAYNLVPLYARAEAWHFDIWTVVAEDVLRNVVWQQEDEDIEQPPAVWA